MVGHRSTEANSQEGVEGLVVTVSQGGYCGRPQVHRG